MTQPKVLISDKMDPKAAAIFKERGIDVDVITGKTKDELIAMIGDYDGLAIRSATKVTADVLAAATNLKVVGRAGIGVDNVDIPEASKKGVIVMNTPFGNSITTAEHAIAMMFALARQIPEANAGTQAGKWPKNDFMGVELTSKTLGLIGCGNIGSIVAERALGLRMKVVAFDPFLTPERAIELGVEKADLDTLLAKADFITLHTPLTDQTRNILSAENIAKAKKGVRIINCARGGLIDEAALKDALDSGPCRGRGARRVRAGTAGGRSSAVQRAELHLHPASGRVDRRSAGQCRDPGGRADFSDYLLTGGITNALNVPSLSAEEAPKLRPYMELAEKLGSLVGQLAHDNLTDDLGRSRRCGRRAQPQADHRRGAHRPDAPLFGQREHGQRTASRARTRARRARSAPRPRRRLSHARPRHRRDRARATARSRAPCSATATRASSKCSGSRSRPISTATCSISSTRTRRASSAASAPRSAKPDSTSAPSTSAAAPRAAKRCCCCRLDSPMPEPLLWQLCQLPGVKTVKGLKF